MKNTVTDFMIDTLKFGKDSVYFCSTFFFFSKNAKFIFNDRTSICIYLIDCPIVINFKQNNREFKTKSKRKMNEKKNIVLFILSLQFFLI